MSSTLGREALQAMKRTDIQKLCKDYGVKANLKTEALIDLLLDAAQPQPRRNPPQLPQRPPSTRISNLTGVRPRGQSTSSMIIHDSDAETESSFSQRRHQVQPHEQPVPQRTRKAKETQYRLGVGRPVIAGGSGARAVTKSTSTSRTPKRARSNRSIKPSETTIAEAQMQTLCDMAYAEVLLEPELDGSTEVLPHSKNPQHANGQTQLDLQSMVGPSGKALETVVAEAVAPVKQELDSHKAQLTDLKEKVASLIESFGTKIRNLTADIEDLRARAKSSPSVNTSVPTAQEHSIRIPEPPATPKRVRTPYRPSFALPTIENPESSELSSEPSFNLDSLVPPDSRSVNDLEKSRQPGSLLPGFPHSMLGKRPRDSFSSDTLGIFESVQEGTETEPENNGDELAHKRAKVHDSEDKSSLTLQPNEPPDLQEFSRRRGGSSFPVFSGSEEDLPPPVERLANFYGPSSPPIISAPATSSANNVENQNPFSFTFVPIASTPTQAVYPLTMGTFPHPEPPTSPSPAANPDRPGSRHSDRFVTFGVTRSSSTASGRAASGGSLARPEASGSSGIQRALSSNEIASGIGLTAIKTSATEQDTPAPPAKRTMYGTELDGDTRFGDFGVEGVASGFWAGGRF
ncbi:hypothetical protein JVU11DRAFT_5278 [Chiua virens]|nr:hypothetical protein JVU11DRAFT_5278 [Chiua virens]